MSAKKPKSRYSIPEKKRVISFRERLVEIYQADAKKDQERVEAAMEQEDYGAWQSVRTFLSLSDKEQADMEATRVDGQRVIQFREVGLNPVTQQSFRFATLCKTCGNPALSREAVGNFVDLGKMIWNEANSIEIPTSEGHPCTQTETRQISESGNTVTDDLVRAIRAIAGVKG